MIDRSHWVVFGDVVIKAGRQQGRLTAISPSMKRFMQPPHRNALPYSTRDQRVFTQPRPGAALHCRPLAASADVLNDGAAARIVTSAARFVLRLSW
jgi:hypothetical protein